MIADPLACKNLHFYFKLEMKKQIFRITTALESKELFAYFKK